MALAVGSDSQSIVKHHSSTLHHETYEVNPYRANPYKAKPYMQNLLSELTILSLETNAFICLDVNVYV